MRHCTFCQRPNPSFVLFRNEHEWLNRAHARRRALRFACGACVPEGSTPAGAFAFIQPEPACLTYGAFIAVIQPDTDPDSDDSGPRTGA